MAQLILIRHGQSQWNLENRFTGWVDVNLTADGEAQARKAGQLMKQAGLEIDQAFGSVLTRAVRTLWLSLEELNQVYVPQTLDWRLNERHYGALTGLNKTEVAAEHGEAQLKIWRRSYDTPPQPLAADNPVNPCKDRRYAHLPAEALPATESLKTTLDRVVPYWQQEIFPHVQAGKTVLVAAHGNSLRALVKHLMGISNEEIVKLEIPTGNPMLLNLDAQGTPKAARYLDAERAQPLPEFA